MQRSQRTKITKFLKENLNYIPKNIFQSKTGIMNQTYLIDNKYILQKENKGKDKNIFENKLLFLENVKSKNFEQFIKFDPKTNFKLSKYIEGNNLEKNDLNIETIKQVIYVLKDMHKQKIKGIKNYDLFHKLKTYKKDFKPIIKDEKILICETETILKKYPLKISHNDVLLNNFIYNKKDKTLHLIDYDFLGCNYEIFDFVSFIEENNLENTTISKIFWDNAKNIINFNNDEIKTLYKFFSLYWYYWAKYLYKKTKEKSFNQIALMKKNKLIKKPVTE